MAQLDRKKILVVDDSETNLLLLRAVLEDAGYEVKLINDSYQAVKYVEKQQPDLVLLDLLMPGMDGFEFMIQLKEENTRLSLPIIVVTAYDSRDNTQKAMDLGATDVINKPIDISDFLSKVEQIVN
jgi:CheY-like chemotaxis protein